MSRSPGLISRRILLALLMVSAFSMAGLPGTGRTLYYRDVGQNHLPNRALSAEMIRSGELPLWNPHRGNGQPFMANPNSLVLRPTTPLFLLFPTERAHVPFILSVMLLCVLAAAGTFLLLRETGHSDAASAAGALAFVLSGAFQSLGQLVNLLEGAAWIPVALWLLNRSLRRGWRPWAPLAGIALAMVLSTGEPVLVAVLVLAAAALPDLRIHGRGLAVPVLVAGLVAVLVASAQLLPLLELVTLSSRGGDLPAEQVLKWSLPPEALLETVIPGLWGDPSRAGTQAYWGSGLFDSSLPFFPSIHLSLPVLLLAAAALAAGNEGHLRVGLAGLAGLLLALGRHTPVHALLTGWVPGLAQSRYPAKWFLLVAWCVSILAAEGFDRLVAREGAGPTPASGQKPEPPAPPWALLGVAAGTAVAAGALAMAAGRILVPPVRWLLSIPAVIPDEVVGGPVLLKVGASLCLAGAAAGLLLFVASSRAIAHGRRAFFVLILVALSLLLATSHLNPKAPPRVVFQPSPLLAAMPAEERKGRRVFGFPRPPGFAYRRPAADLAAAAGIPPDSLAWGMRWDTRTLRFAAPYLHGVRGAYDQGSESLLGLEPGAEVARRLREEIPLEEAVRYLRAASVGWVVAYGSLEHPLLRTVASLPGESNVPVTLYALERTVPRARVVSSVAEASSPAEAVGAIGSGAADPASTVVLEREEGEMFPPSPAAGESPGQAAIILDRPGRVDVRVATQGPSWLVLTDTWAPGWRATVNGDPARVRRADGMFRAVRLEGGESLVSFTYRPGSVTRGLAGSAAGLLAASLLVLLWWSGRHRGLTGGEA